jgi:curved DNA-binding protein
MLSAFSFSMNDHYQTLGVDRGATADQIKQAYRRLAMKHHPDKGGDAKAFQEIQAAYTVLGDPQRRAEYDNPRPQFGGGGFGFQHGTPPGFDFQTIFDVFGTRFQQQRVQRAQMTLWITLTDIAQPTRKTVNVGTPQGNQIIEIEIPLGIEDGDSVQYSGIAPGGMDLIVTFRLHPHPKWSRNGANLTMECDINCWDLILGAEIKISDILGNQLSLTIPPRTQNRTTFRLQGRGLARKGTTAGDLFVRVSAVIPENIPESVIQAIAQARTQ